MKRKPCMKCGEVKPLSAFYNHPMMADGTVNKCKECTKRDVRENRIAKIDYYTEYERSRANRPYRVAARAEYQKTARGRERGNARKKRWSESNCVKRAAQIMVGNAVRDKKIIKSKSCQGCGKGGRIHGHHDDYARPLDVRWLCAKCHNTWHKENGSGRNG